MIRNVFSHLILFADTTLKEMECRLKRALAALALAGIYLLTYLSYSVSALPQVAQRCMEARSVNFGGSSSPTGIWRAGLGEGRYRPSETLPEGL